MLNKQFFCINSRNNGYAISTPTHEQYKGDGIGESVLLTKNEKKILKM